MKRSSVRNMEGINSVKKRLFQDDPPEVAKIIKMFSKLNISDEEKPEDMSSMSANTEMASLLSTPEHMEVDTEMPNDQLESPNALSINSEMSYQEVRVHTDRGDILVAVQGDCKKPAILTYHDLGLNHLYFHAFFNHDSMRAVVSNFCFYHINAPGQEAGASVLPSEYIYPTVDELASQINYVISHFGIKTFIGFGVGVGGNILTRYALKYPHTVTMLVLINCTSTQAGWLEWLYQKLNVHALRNQGRLTEISIKYLMWHHFGRCAKERSYDLCQTYYNQFNENLKSVNFAMFANSYVNRTDLNISRDGNTIKQPVLNITASDSPHLDDTITFNGRLNPTNSNWLKLSNCAMPLEEKPDKVAEALCLFLQGEGYLAPLSPTKVLSFGHLSDVCARGRGRDCRSPPVIRITENPISAVVC